MGLRAFIRRLLGCPSVPTMAEVDVKTRQLIGQHRLHEAATANPFEDWMQCVESEINGWTDDPPSMVEIGPPRTKALLALRFRRQERIWVLTRLEHTADGDPEPWFEQPPSAAEWRQLAGFCLARWAATNWRQATARLRGARRGQ